MEKYYKFSDYLRKKGHGKVRKITVDAGFSCPNIDGKISEKGCIFCNNKSFNTALRKPALPLELQIKQGASVLQSRYGTKNYIVYFQAFSNTYAPIEQLKQAYDSIKSAPGIIGLAIGTRPDCINEQTLELIASYTKDYEVWIELGLQSSKNATLDLINRGHTFEDFLAAVKLIRKHKELKICAHVILGLPGENKDDVISTAKQTGLLKLEAVKVHPLHVVKDTELEKQYSRGGYIPLELDEYADFAAAFLEHLRPETVIQRLTADCPKDLLVAPDWIKNKTKVLTAIDKRLTEKNSFQGKLYI